MKFRNRILLCIWGVALGVQLIALAIIQYWIREQVQERFAADLMANSSTVHEIFLLRSIQDIRACQVIAESPRLKAVAELRDRETALQLSREINQELLSDLFALTDSKGRPLVQLVEGQERGFEASGFSTVAQALTLKPHADVWQVGGELYRVATVPVSIGPDLVGTLTIGFRFRADDVGFVKSVTGSEVVLVSDTVAHLWTLHNKGEAVTAAGKIAGRSILKKNPDVFKFETSRDLYVATVAPLGVAKPVVGFLLMKAVEQEVEAALYPFLRIFAFISVVVLVLAGVVGYWISNSMTRPIGALVQGTAEVSRGNYDHRIDVRMGGELKFLAGKFEEMSASLKEKLTQLNDRNRALEQALKNLKDTQGRLQAVLDTSPSVIYVKDLEGRYLLVNRKFEAVFAVNSDQVSGKTDVQLFPKEISAALALNDRQVLSGEKSIEWEQIIPQAVKPHNYISIKFPLRDGVGTVYAICGVLTDVTDQKVLEEQLRQAQKLESLGTLAGGIAHDFNNILSIILGHASILEPRLGEPAKVRESVDSITRAVQRGTNLVRQLLTFARKTDVLFESVNLNAVVEELVKMLQATLPKNIGFSQALDSNLPLITADANQLHQALLNLCVNARDVMPTGGTLSVRTQVVPGTEVKARFPAAIESYYVRLSVADTGSGMDQATKNRIFEPFFTTKGIGRGTGLGLAVVYGVVNSHHGFIDFESEVGQGTTFHMYFPVPKGEIVAKEIATKAGGVIRGGNELILVVEDEGMLADLLKDVLQLNGYEVVTAGDGIEALEIYKKEGDRIALVLTDLGLPRLGGWELVKQIRVVNPGTKVIVASGYFDPNARSEMVKAGAKDFVQKPYVPQEVLRRVRDVIDGVA